MAYIHVVWRQGASLVSLILSQLIIIFSLITFVPGDMKSCENNSYMKSIEQESEQDGSKGRQEGRGGEGGIGKFLWQIWCHFLCDLFETIYTNTNKRTSLITDWNDRFFIGIISIVSISLVEMNFFQKQHFVFNIRE